MTISAAEENEKMYEEYRIGEITMSDRTEYISRQAAIDALHGYFDGMLETDTWSPCDVYGLIEILPSADAVEVVRCEDCMLCQYDAIFKQYWCIGKPVKADDYCSMGVRKKDG